MTGFISLGVLSQPPLIEWGDGYWSIWLMYDKAVPLGRSRAGTFVVLNSDGSADRLTVEPDGTVSHTYKIKPQQG